MLVISNPLMAVLFQQSSCVVKLLRSAISSVELYGLVVLRRLVRSTALADFLKALFMAKSWHVQR